MYYTSCVKPNSPVNATNTTDTKISTLHEQIKKKFREEPQEIQDEVMRIHSEQTASKNTSINASVAEDDEDFDLVTDMEMRTR